MIDPASGKDKPILNVLNHVFHQHAIEWSVSVTQKYGDATALARQAATKGYDIVCGHGGDGTQMEVANGLMGSDIPMAILPGGTGNAMAFELNIPRDLRQAAQLIVASKKRRTIDLARIGERVFMLRTYTGKQAEDAASREMKDKYGNLAYVAEGLKILRHPPEAHYHATIDGEEFKGKAMICYVFNAGASGGVALPGIADVDVSDGLLDFFVISKGVKPLRAVSHYVLKVGNSQAGVYRWRDIRSNSRNSTGHPPGAAGRSAVDQEVTRTQKYLLDDLDDAPFLANVSVIYSASHLDASPSPTFTQFRRTP